MSKYLKLFDTHSQYESYTADTETFITPNVSFCLDTPNEVHYNPYTPPTPSHDYVEIGGLKWATMNIGATSITDTGLYFQWGDTQGYTASEVGSGTGKKYFNVGFEDYKYCSGAGTSSSAMTKYNSTDGLTVLDASDDAAQATWGGQWRMPTTDEFIALGEAVTSAWTNNYQGSGVSGLVCTDKTDSSKVLFFPAAGRCIDGSVVDVGKNGNYWSSSVYSSNLQSAFLVYFHSKFLLWNGSGRRCLGYSVRPVLGE